MPADRTHIINTRHGLNINLPAGRDIATLLRCPRCQAPVIVGLDEPVMALTAVADPRTLTPLLELAALLQQRGTYRLHRDPAGKHRLRRRDRDQIAGQPAGTVDVVAEHTCGQPLGNPINLHRNSAIPADERPPF